VPVMERRAPLSSAVAEPVPDIVASMARSTGTGERRALNLCGACADGDRWYDRSKVETKRSAQPRGKVTTASSMGLTDSSFGGLECSNFGVMERNNHTL
jgi:hypothetical protein